MLAEMFEGNSADMCAGKFPLMSMGGRAEGLAFADPGARTPIGVSGFLYTYILRAALKRAFLSYTNKIYISCFFVRVYFYIEKYLVLVIFCFVFLLQKLGFTLRSTAPVNLYSC